MPNVMTSGTYVKVSRRVVHVMLGIRMHCAVVSIVLNKDILERVWKAV